VGPEEDRFAIAGIARRRERKLDLSSVEGAAGIGVLVGVDCDQEGQVANLTTAPQAVAVDCRLELETPVGDTAPLEARDA